MILFLILFFIPSDILCSWVSKIIFFLKLPYSHQDYKCQDLAPGCNTLASQGWHILINLQPALPPGSAISLTQDSSWGKTAPRPATTAACLTPGTTVSGRLLGGKREKYKSLKATLLLILFFLKRASSPIRHVGINQSALPHCDKNAIILVTFERHGKEKSAYLF